MLCVSFPTHLIAEVPCTVLAVSAATRGRPRLAPATPPLPNTLPGKADAERDLTWLPTRSGDLAESWHTLRVGRVPTALSRCTTCGLRLSRDHTGIQASCPSHLAASVCPQPCAMLCPQQPPSDFCRGKAHIHTHGLYPEPWAPRGGVTRGIPTLPSSRQRGPLSPSLQKEPQLRCCWQGSEHSLGSLSGHIRQMEQP